MPPAFQMDQLDNDESLVNPLLTDLYQISMAQAYYKAGRHNEHATFDLYFRHAPFSGSLAVCAGLSSIVSFLQTYRITSSHTLYISKVLPCEPSFLDYLQTLSTNSIKIHAHREGSLVTPEAPMLRIDGPLALVQLLETPLLNLVNYASLVATNALRFRLAAPDAALYEFGLRRAQGPDGAMSASKYCYLGGFDGTSNVAAGYKYGIPVVGTHAHSFVQSFQSLDDIRYPENVSSTADGRQITVAAFQARAAVLRKALAPGSSEGELAAFITYAIAYPSMFSSLVDTYSTLRSGVPNFMCVALALNEYGFRAIGIRLDSGDLASLSVRVHALMHDLGQRYALLDGALDTKWKEMVDRLKIMASNDITVKRLLEIQSCDHKVSAYGIGTHLVTCLEQPALGCVYKLCSISNSPRMKFSESAEKMSLPGVKVVYRLLGADGRAAYDVVMLISENPVEGQANTFRLRSNPMKRITVQVSRVEGLLSLVWHGRSHLKTESKFEYLKSCREWLKLQAEQLHMVLQRKSGSDGYPLLISDGIFETMERLRLDVGIPASPG